MPAINAIELVRIREADRKAIPHPREVSYHQFDEVMHEVNNQSMHSMSIIDTMIALEEELGCSIFEMARRERERQREHNTVDEGYVHPAPAGPQ